MSFFREQLEEWLSKIDVSAGSVLDVGGGENPVKDRVRSFNVKIYKILDNNYQYKPDYYADINYIFDLDRKFDILFCLEVFEYIWNPKQAIENLGSFLKPGGIAYISFPTIYPVHNPYGIDYLRYTKFGIEKLLPFGEFKSWEITPRTATLGIKALGEFYRLEGMHPISDRMIFDIGYLVKAIKGGDNEQNA